MSVVHADDLPARSRAFRPTTVAEPVMEVRNRYGVHVYQAGVRVVLSGTGRAQVLFARGVVPLDMILVGSHYQLKIICRPSAAYTGTPGQSPRLQVPPAP